jgi:cellulose synthase/poly-beta-1,6-N-acetylglucosamine synthase-like glycosyltransferase
MVLLSIIAVLFTIYAVLIIYYWQSWKSIPPFQPTFTKPSTKISIIVPARNEEANIEKLLQSISDQSYPKELFEVIVVNDNSTDNTAAMAQQFSFVKLISLKEDPINSYKKKAIETGIAAATGDLIITTDADCIVTPAWLTTIENFYNQTGAVFIVAPVVIEANSSLVQIFQSMDFMVLQGITGASVHKKVHSMCNGANLAYEQEAFHTVKGFTGIDYIASGDDMLLMYKIQKQFSNRIQYLKSKDAVVTTRAEKTWSAFFSQRIRWASKADKYDDKRIFAVLLIVYLFNLSFPVLFIAGWWNNFYWLSLLILLVAKTLVELPLMFSIASFFNKNQLLKYFVFLQPLHILYTIIAGWLGKFGSYEWKGRRVK